jgi:uncharacterized protein YjbI with pentapeptide repeats
LSKADLSEANLSKANLSDFYYWQTNFKYCKVTKKVKEEILAQIQLEDVEE